MIICKSCGTANEDETYFCEKCGKLLETSASSPSTQAAASSHAPVPTPPNAANSYCSKCGAKAAVGASFCAGCGERLASPNTVPTQAVMPQTAAPVTAMPTTSAPSQKICEFNVTPFAMNINLMVGAIGPLRAGKLEIFTDKVNFTPGKMNLVDAKQTILMSDIASVELCTVMMLQTGVKITKRGGESFTYIAGTGGKREQIADAIRRQL